MQGPMRAHVGQVREVGRKGGDVRGEGPECVFSSLLALLATHHKRDALSQHGCIIFADVKHFAIVILHIIRCQHPLSPTRLQRDAFVSSSSLLCFSETPCCGTTVIMSPTTALEGRFSDVLSLSTARSLSDNPRFADLTARGVSSGGSPQSLRASSNSESSPVTAARARHSTAQAMVPGINPSDPLPPRRAAARPPLVSSQSMPELTRCCGSPVLTRREVREFVPAQLRILVAEDNVILQRIIVKALKNAGFGEVRVVGDGLRAIDAYQQSCRALLQGGSRSASPDNMSVSSGSSDSLCGTTATPVPSESSCVSAESEMFDVVLMDVHMPNLNGYQATRAIRAHEEVHGLPHVPIIAYTSDSNNIDLQNKCRAAGMNNVVLKKPSPAALSNIIREVVCAAQ